MTWTFVPVIAVLLLATAVACSAEPEVIEIEKIVEVEKVVVKEVPVEVVVEKEVVREVPVQVVVEKEVIREVPVEVVVEKIVEVEVIKEVKVPGETVIVEKEVPVEVVVEKVVEVEVVKEVKVEKVVTPTPAPRPTATPLPELNITQSISVGIVHTCGLRENGEAVCWGANGDGQSDPPAGRYTAISGGDWHTCGLLESGRAVCWGENYSGQSDSGGRRLTAISAGGRHTCGLKENGDAVCWGSNSSGQLYAPDGLLVAISAGDDHNCGLRENGDAVCWGYNYYGQATNVAGEGFVTIRAGKHHNCGLRENGTGLCWGGPGSSADEVKYLTLDGPYHAIAAGFRFTCALETDGTPVCWGNNDDGQVEPPGGISFSAISAGRNHACALRKSGEAVCWGYNEYGQSNPPGGRFAIPVSVPSSRALPTYSSFDAASILARFSTSDAIEGEARANAASELIARHRSGDIDTARVLDLLHTIAPELDLDERRRAAGELARLSENDQWNEADAARGVFYLASLVAGYEPNPDARLEAAFGLVGLYEAGDLDADIALYLMDIIAPELDINERRQAAAALARLAADDDWDHADRMAAASETFRLVTGVPLAAEQRIGATVDLAGVAVKIFDTDDSFDDRDIDTATTVIKRAISGDLTTDSLANILGFGN